MKKISQIFLLFLSLIILFNSPVLANGLTDIEDINGMFVFDTENTDNELSDASMKIITTDEETNGEFWNAIFTKYNGIIIGISGLASLTFVILFIYNFTKLGAAAANPQDRKQRTTILAWTFIGAALSSGIALFVTLGFNLFD